MSIYLRPHQTARGAMKNPIKFRVGLPDLQGNRPVVIVMADGELLEGLYATPKAVDTLYRLAQKQSMPAILTPRRRLS